MKVLLGRELDVSSQGGACPGVGPTSHSSHSMGGPAACRLPAVRFIAASSWRKLRGNWHDLKATNYNKIFIAVFTHTSPPRGVLTLFCQSSLNAKESLRPESPSFKPYNPEVVAIISLSWPAPLLQCTFKKFLLSFLYCTLFLD